MKKKNRRKFAKNLVISIFIRIIAAEK